MSVSDPDSREAQLPLKPSLLFGGPSLATWWKQEPLKPVLNNCALSRGPRVPQFLRAEDKIFVERPQDQRHEHVSC